MQERNLCVESGCKALCCRDPKISIKDASEADILRWFPNAKKMSLRNMFVARTPSSVFYINKENGSFFVDITGYCPNLDSNFNCRIQDTKPEACKRFERGQDACSLIRLDANLKTFRAWDFERSRETREVVK